MRDRTFYKYDELWYFIDGLAVAQKYGFFGYINELGDEVVPIKYDSIYLFKEDMARVERKGLYGFVDKKGV